MTHKTELSAIYDCVKQANQDHRDWVVLRCGPEDFRAVLLDQVRDNPGAYLAKPSRRVCGTQLCPFCDRAMMWDGTALWCANGECDNETACAGADGTTPEAAFAAMEKEFRDE